MATSQNGYTANDLSRTKVWTIPGTVRTVRLRFGSPGELLTLWAAWFHEEIEDIEVGVFDDWGYAERPIRGSSTTLSNHASGTALDLNATRHPLGVPTTRTFTDAQIRKIRARLRDFDGCIRWGGDYTGRPDAMHFEINASVEKCDATLKKIKTPATPPAPPEEPDMEPKQIAGAPVTLTEPDGKKLETTVQGALDDTRDRVLAGNKRMRTMDAKLDKIIETLGKEAGQ